MWPFKPKEPLVEVKPEFRPIKLHRVTTIEGNWDRFWVTSEDANAMKQAEGRFVEVTQYYRARRSNPDHVLGDSIFVGFVQCQTLSINILQIKYISEPFEAQLILNFEPLKEYYKKIAARSTASGLWVS